MTSSNYWSRVPVDRRALLRGASLGFAGVAGAALIGCNASDEPSTPSVPTTTPGSTESPPADQPVPRDQVRIPRGAYDQPIAATPAEQNPAVNAIRGGVLTGWYLDPPRMDINRALSCTIFHTMDYTNNKLINGRTGPLAHPFVPEIVGDLAESWESSPDGTTFTFHLHHGIKTHNVEPTLGREFTSEDVKLSFERYRAGGSQQDVFAPVTEIETPDDYTVRVTLDRPLVDFPINLSSWSFMWVKELIAGEDPLVDRVAVGTGPFVQEAWTPKEGSVFRRHEEYFKEGLPYLDGVRVSVQNDIAVQMAAFRTDNAFEFQAYGVVDEASQQLLLDEVSTAVLWKHPLSRGANVNGWHFQMSNPVFQDERVRRAISLAFDRAELDLALLGGDNADPEGAFSNPPMPWAFLYDERPTGAANGPWYRFDPQQARQLLQAAGYSETEPLEFTHVGWYDRAPSAQVIIPGITEIVPELRIGFREVDNPTHVTLLSERNFDASIGIVWGPPGHSMDQWIYPWYHSDGGLNYNNINHADLDALLEQQRAEADPEGKKQLWRQIWDMIHDQVWDFWWPEPMNRNIWHNYVLNYRPHGLMGGFVCYTSNQTEQMWLDEDAPMRQS